MTKDEKSGRAKSAPSADISRDQAAKALKKGGPHADEMAVAHHASMKAYLTGDSEDHMTALMAHKTLANKLTGDKDGDEADCAVHSEMAREHAKHAHKETIENRLGACLLNRDFKTAPDNWFHIVPRGEFIHQPTGLMQVLDESAGTSIVNRFQSEKQAPNFPGILVDFDHFSEDGDKSSEAAGWIEDLQNRADGVWAKIRWSDIGKQAVEGGRYRLVSPVWNLSDCEQLGNRRVRPNRIKTVAITNDNNLKGLTPLSNRAAECDVQPPKNNMDHKLMLANLLGLAATATDTDFEAAVALGNSRMRDGAELSNRTSLIALAVGLDKGSDTTKIVNRCTEIVTENATLKTGHTALLGEQVDRDLIEFADVIGNNEVAKANLLKNRSETISFLKALKKPAGSATPLHNRNHVKTPEGTIEDGKDAPATEAEKVHAAKIKNRANELRAKNPRLSYDASWRQAVSETESNALAAK